MLAVAAVAVFGIFRPEGAHSPVQVGDGVRLARVEPVVIPGTYSGGSRAGDLLLESEAISLVIGASRATPERRQDFGRILDLTPSAWGRDALEHFALEAKIGGKGVALLPTLVAPTAVGTTPAVRIHHEALGGRLFLSTLVRVRAGVPYAEIVTRVVNAGGVPIKDLQIGDRVAWPGFPTFVPGLGEVETPGRRSLQWFGMRGSDHAYAVAYPDGPRDVTFRVQRHSDQVAWPEAKTLGPGQEITLTRYFVTSFRSLADAASWVYRLLDIPVGVVVGEVEEVPENSVITAVATDGTIALRSHVEYDKTFTLPLRPGRYTVLLQTPGGLADVLVDVSLAGPPAVADFVIPRPGSLVFRVTDSAERQMPARIIVRGVGATPNPLFGPHFRAAGGMNEVHSATGSGSVDLPPGRYDVDVTRGPEYSLVRRRITVDSGSGVALWAVLVREVEVEGWLACDFHLHAAPSPDSEVSLEDRVASLLAAGVQCAVATDHNHVTDYSPAVRALQSEDLLSTIIGVEVTTKTWGHFNAFPLERGDSPPPYANILPSDIFAYVRKERPSAVIQVNHPWMAGYGYFKRALLDEKTGEVGVEGFSTDFDTFEVVNGFELGKGNEFDKNLEHWFDLLNIGYLQTAVGNSDSHHIAREWAGYPRTYVSIAPFHGSTTERVAAALKAGRAVVSNGAFIDFWVNGAPPGGFVSVEDGTASVSIRVLAADWIDIDRVEIIVDGVVVDILPASPLGDRGVRLERTIDVPLEGDAWIVAVARGTKALEAILPGMKTPPFAFTNPVRVDVDGDGIYTPPSRRDDQRVGPPRPPPRSPVFITPEDLSEFKRDASAPPDPTVSRQSDARAPLFLPRDAGAPRNDR